MPRTTAHRLFAAVFLLLSSLTAQPAQPQPSAPELPVRGYILLDFHSGLTLAELNADERMEPASITKLMSAYVIYNSLQDSAINSTDQVTISEKAWLTGGSRMFVEVGKQVSVEDLLMGMVVQSGNDATIALAEYVAGSEEAFADLMNRKALELGLKDSHFVNSTGLPDANHYMTARDIAILARTIILEFPEHYARYSVRSFTYNGITQHNRNRLLWQDESVDGVKTGHTSSAGFCLAASAQREGMRLISVVLGAATEDDRFSASRTLLNHGFRAFETHLLYNAGEALTQARIYKGETDTVPLGLAEPLYVTIPKGRYQDMKLTSQMNANIEAPTHQGDPLGNVIVTLDESKIAEVPLVALNTVAEAGLVGRAWDSVLLMFNSWLE